MPAFQRNPKVANYIGRIISAYGELEYQLHACARITLDDKHIALKEMFGIRGETKRIEKASSLMRESYVTARLTALYDSAIDAMTHCRDIRNQYAHCHWADDDKNIFFVNLEETAKQANTTKHKFRHIDLGVLEAQISYFGYTLHLLEYMEHEYQSQTNPKFKNHFKKPTPLEKPVRYTPENVSPKYNPISG
jgi:hypothetical protein